MRRNIHVVAALIERDGRVLLDRRRKGSHLEDRWALPGGKLEAGESDEAALVRELEEELGVKARISGPEIARVHHAYEHFDIELVLYPVEIEDGEPRALEVAEIAWFELSRLRELPMPPADVPLIAAILGR